MSAVGASGGAQVALARRLMLCCVLAVAALALAPGGASAYVTCDYLPVPRWVTVGLYSAGDEATISRDGNSKQIYVQGKPCGAAEILNTDFILVADHSGGSTTVRIVGTAGGGFQEGSDDIVKFSVSLGAGAHDALHVDLLDTVGWGSPYKLYLGEKGLNLNAKYETAAPDVDLVPIGVEDVSVAGYEWVTGQGGGGTGDKPFGARLVIHGTNKSDFLEGGDGPSTLLGGIGNDALLGRAGDDTLDGGPNDDVITGGAGSDEVSYADAPAGVRVDLSATGTQDTGGAGSDTIEGVERLTGSAFADALTGSPGPNAIEGGPGPDVITGGEGVDTLRGSGGLDAMFSHDASADSVTCGEGPDALSVDAFDTLAPDCGMTPSPSPAPSGSPPEAGPDATAAPVLQVRVPRQSRRAVLARGLRVVVSCSTACRASGRLLASRATARRFGLRTGAASRTVGRLQPLALTAGSPRSTRVRLRRAWRHALLRARGARLALRARATDEAGRTSAPVRTTVTVRGRAVR